MLVLGIETTCDETSVSIVNYDNGKFEILSNVILSQEIHNIFGGVFPEQAFRKHQENIIPILSQALEVIDNIREIDLIGVSAYPGLLGALAIGVAAAKTISQIINKPILPVNHLWAHLLVNFKQLPINNEKYLGIVISGGHTNAFVIENLVPLRIISISSSLDDSIGESFDKVARMLKLPFPGGPVIDKLAQAYKNKMNNKKFELLFPIPNPENYSFSYSGLKTAVKNYLDKNPNFCLEQVCFSFQYSAVKHVINKLEKMVLDFGIKKVLVGGGVAANSFLREELNLLRSRLGIEVFIPEPTLCTDNAAMVAIAAVFIHLSRFQISDEFDIYPSQMEGDHIWNTI